MRVHRVDQVRDYESPFDDVPGFRHDWWVESFAHLVKPDVRGYSFTDDVSGEEISRVLLRENAGFSDLEDAGVSLPRSAVAVDRIEVRADLSVPRRGIGRNTVRMLETMFPTNTMYAFAEGPIAISFWQSTFWEFKPRRDGRTGYRPLFVLNQS